MNQNSNILIYQNENGNIKVDVRFEDESIWLSQKQLAEVFGKSLKTINEHINNIFSENELHKDSVIRNYRITASDSKNYNVAHYNLDMIIAIGFRVRSSTGTNFRIWAIEKLKEYITKGFILNDERFKSGNTMSYFDELQQTPIYMKDWIQRLYAVISMNGKELLTHAGKISHQIAKEKSELGVCRTHLIEAKNSIF